MNMERPMPTAMKLSELLIEQAKPAAQVMHRSVAEQIEYWARLGKVAEENPDLPINMLQDILASIEEVKAGNTNVYQFG
jgi:DNA polymerase III psi subunit